MTEFDLDTKRKRILEAEGHLLIEGGPGAGKTTIALLKAKTLGSGAAFRTNQKILFLSFARATVSRVEEQAAKLLSKEDKKRIEINTYHGFCWSILQTYGSLLIPLKSFKLITPPNLSARINEIPEEQRHEAKVGLAYNEGTICFDLFSQLTAEILGKSKKVQSILSKAYPFIIVDEFQDTDENEWQVIKFFGQCSTIIALADLEQRIFEFRGASLSRIPEFLKHFSCVRFDLGKDNNRSAGRDIVQFGDDLLIGKNIGRIYKDVTVKPYKFHAQPKSYLKYELLNRIKTLNKARLDYKWSIAILVKKKQETLNISSYLSDNNISHEVIIDPSGPSLSAGVIANLLEPSRSQQEIFVSMVSGIINHIKGRKGDSIPQNDLKNCKFLETHLTTGKISGSKQKQLIEEMWAIVRAIIKITFTGIPGDDWLTVRRLFQSSHHEVLKNVYEDAKYLRLLNKGAVLSERLAETWRAHKSYLGASKAIEDALTQEHFSMTSKKFHGIYVMNIHKSKGKEFDEVIIWEDAYNPMVFYSSDPFKVMQERILLRVAATRSRVHTTFLTPEWKPCYLLI